LKSDFAVPHSTAARLAKLLFNGPKSLDLETRQKTAISAARAERTCRASFATPEASLFDETPYRLRFSQR
jgi:hypothetical protein